MKTVTNVTVARAAICQNMIKNGATEEQINEALRNYEELRKTKTVEIAILF